MRTLSHAHKKVLIFETTLFLRSPQKILKKGSPTFNSLIRSSLTVPNLKCFRFALTVKFDNVMAFIDRIIIRIRIFYFILL